MKTEIKILFLGMCLVLSLSFLIFNIQKSNLSGFAVYNGSSVNESLNDSIIITKEAALQSINESEQIIQEMLKYNFSILYMNDTLTEAKKTFEQVRYAEILRGNINSTEKEKSEARRALALINWGKISYADVLAYTKDIKQRREKAFLLTDEINVEEKKLSASSSIEISNETKQILKNAEIAFQEDRYQDAENLLSEFKKAFEQEKAEALNLSGIKQGIKNFFQKYWIYIFIITIILGIAGYFAYKKFEKKLIKMKIKKMKIEKDVLVSLMKKSQEDRFKKNSISGLVYNIRMKKYQERLQEIEQELPVFENRLDKLNNKKKKFEKQKNN